MSVTLEEAEAIIKAIHKKAEELDIKVIAAVVDESGHTVCVSRMDGAPWGSISVAENKAYTSAAWGGSTAGMTDECKPEGSLYSIHFSNGGRLITFGGGEPLYRNGKLVGAVGVSGGTVDEDVQCAQAGVAAFKSQENVDIGNFIIK